MKPEENKIVIFFETLNCITLPDWVKKNIITALGKGIGQVVTASLDWPTAWFESRAKEIRAKSKGNEVVQNEAASQVAKLFKTDSELANRSLNYYAKKIIDEQINREDVADNFLSEIQYSDAISETEEFVDNDWLNSFWKIAESKSNEEIKIILGKILAKEVLRPKSISPLTLQLISTLSTNIGKAFHKLCNLSIKNGDFTFVIHPNVVPFFNYGELTDYGITFDEQLELEGIGLIRSINIIDILIEPVEGLYDICDYAGIKAKLNFTTGVKVIDFTRAGREIRDLLELVPNKDYTSYLLSLGKEKFNLDN